MTPGHDVTVAIARAIAEVEGMEPHDLGYSLANYVDTDAIERLAAMDNRDWELTFAVPDHEVTVTGHGRIALDGETVGEFAADELSEQY
jgi:hypothetical protein